MLFVYDRWYINRKIIKGIYNFRNSMFKNYITNSLNRKMYDITKLIIILHHRTNTSNTKISPFSLFFSVNLYVENFISNNLNWIICNDHIIVETSKDIIFSNFVCFGLMFSWTYFLSFSIFLFCSSSIINILEFKMRIFKWINFSWDGCR